MSTNYIDPRKSKAAQKNYNKQPERVFKLKQDVVVPAGTLLHRAPLERGGVNRIEAVVGLGRDATGYFNVPVRVAEIDAKEWFDEVTGAEPREETSTHE